MPRILIYGIVFNHNSIADISFIGMTKARISSLKASLIYSSKVAPDSEKKRLISEIEKRGRDNFVIRLLEIVEDDDSSLLMEKAKLKIDEMIMRIKPPLNIKVPLNEADYAHVRGRREVRRMNMMHARESLRQIKKRRDEETENSSNGESLFSEDVNEEEEK